MTRASALVAVFFSGLILISQPPAMSMAQDTAASISTTGQEKALKYHKALRRRPSTGYLFDRFYDAWLATQTIEQLEEFLVEQVNADATTGDRLLLAFFHAKQGDDVKALVQFREALESDSGNALIWYEKAQVESRTLDFDTALADLAKASAAEPKKELANKIAQLRGKLYVRNRQNDEAIKVWKQLIADNPEDNYLIEDVIELQIDEGLYEEAAKLSDQFISRTNDPYEKVVRTLRKGDIIQRWGKREEALKIYGQTLSEVGNDTWLEREILGQIENLFRREDDLVGLKAHYQKMIGDNAKRLALYQSVARLNVELGLMDEAIAGYQKVVELTPGQRDNREALIDILAQAQKTDLAIKQTQSLIKQYPEDAELQLKLANLHHQSAADDKLAKLSAAMDQFIAINDGSEYAYLRAARMFERFKVMDKAAATFLSCTEKFPESLTAKEAYADHLFKNKKKKEAIEIWKALASNADRGNLLRVARQLSSRQEHQAAFDLLFKRLAEFKSNASYLGQLCAEAVYLKKYEQAIPWSLDRVRLSNGLELDTCINQCVQLASKAEQTLEIIDQLNAEKNLNVPSTCLLASLYEQNLNPDKADQLLSESLDDVEGRFDLAADQAGAAQQMLAGQRVRLLVIRQDWSAAAEAAKQRFELPGGRKSANLRQLIELYIRDGQLETALTWIDQWKKISPGSLTPWFNESAILARLGRLADSISVLRIAAQKFPEDADLHMQLGDLYLENGQFKDAERIFWRQFEDAKTLSDKLRWTERVAEIAQRTGEMESLIKKIEERRRNNPQSVEPLLALAQAHRVADNYEGRRKALLEATRIQTDNLPLIVEIARLEESEGDWEKAISTLRKAEKLDPSSRIKEKIATLYMQYGETERGYGILVEIAGGVKSGPREIEKITDAIIGAGDWQVAKDFLQSQLNRFEKDYRLQYLMAVINEELNLVDEAADSFVDLLSPKEEIPGLSAKGQNNLQLDMLTGFLPANAMELMKIGSDAGSVYSYRQEGGNRYGFGFPNVRSTANQTVVLPNSVEECGRYALVHLTTIVNDKEKSDRKPFVDAVRSAGVANAELVFEVDFEQFSPYAGSGSFEYLNEQFPDNSALMAFQVLGGFAGESPDPEFAAKAYDVFKDEQPELAFVALLQAAAADQKHHEKLNRLLETEDTFVPSVITTSAVAQF